MAQNAFLQIKEAESQAQALIKSAQENASQIIKRAEEETTDAFLQLSETCKQQALEKKKKAETNARANSMEFSKETEELCVQMKQKLSLQKPKAVEAVIQIIMA